MPQPKNAKNELHARLERRKTVATLYLRGQSQCEIAVALGVTQPTISTDLKIIRAEWLASTLRDFDAAKSEELKKIDALEREAWAAWDRSCLDAETTTDRTEEARPQAAKRGRGRAKRVEQRRLEVVRRILETTRRKQVGDPRFLQQVAWCIESRLKILLVSKLAEVGGELLGG